MTDRDDTDRENEARVAREYDDFGRRWARGTSPLYEEWATSVATDDELVARIARLPRRLQQPLLLFAAARWQGVPLEPWQSARDAVVERWESIVATASARSTQTNEPNRCATILPALSRIDGPIALLEVGTAAGLCLYPDRYGYTYEAPSGSVTIEPAAGPSPVRLACRVDDDASAPDGLPEVVWRRGIDLSPVDASDEAAVDWLATLIWPGPDHDPRVSRLRAAASLVASDPPTIITGDLLERVEEVALEAPADATLVVFHSAVLLYLDDEQRARFEAIMTRLRQTPGRRIVWLSNELKGTYPSVDAALPDGLMLDQRFVQSIDGEPRALAGQHGAVYETRAFTR